MRSHRSGRVWSGPIHVAEQVGEVLREVGEVTLTGSKHGRLNGTWCWEQIVTVPPSQGAEPLRSSWCAGLRSYWPFNWWHQWSMRDCERLGFAYNYGVMSRPTDYHCPSN